MALKIDIDELEKQQANALACYEAAQKNYISIQQQVAMAEMEARYTIESYERHLDICSDQIKDQQKEHKKIKGKITYYDGLLNESLRMYDLYQNEANEHRLKADQFKEAARVYDKYGQSAQHYEAIKSESECRGEAGKAQIKADNEKGAADLYLKYLNEWCGKENDLTKIMADREKDREEIKTKLNDAKKRTAKQIKDLKKQQNEALKLLNKATALYHNISKKLLKAKGLIDEYNKL